MGLPSFTRLFWDADARKVPVAVAAAGGDDPTVLKALETAVEHGWALPVLVGPDAAIRRTAEECDVSLRGFTIVPAEGNAVAAAFLVGIRNHTSAKRR